VNLSEGRLSFLAHALQRCVLDEKLGRVRSDRLFLNEAKRALVDAFSVDDRLDQLVRARMPKRVLPGSREWDVLYRKYYDEERRKLSGRPRSLLRHGVAPPRNRRPRVIFNLDPRGVPC